jgi:hypothetical protein
MLLIIYTTIQSGGVIGDAVDHVQERVADRLLRSLGVGPGSCAWSTLASMVSYM